MSTPGMVTDDSKTFRLDNLKSVVVGGLALVQNVHVWHDCTLITNLMHRLLFIRKILLSSTCFEHQVLIFRRTQLYTSSIWYRHSL